MKRLAALCAIAMLGVTAAPKPTAADLNFPRYSHIFVIMEENKDYGEIIDSTDSPAINALAKKYGVATQFYAETHPSEPNYIALIGGYTYGIQDDAAFYCKPHDTRPYCKGSDDPGFPDHTIHGPSLATQLETAHLTWKNYNESLPTPGSLAVLATDPHGKNVPTDLPVYASKHSGFINFASVQNDPQRAQKIVGFDRLHADLASGNVPNFSFIIPNLCDEMHGASGGDTPEDCDYAHEHELIWRGDQTVKALVAEIMASPVWKSPTNAAIVITFDEDDRDTADTTKGCCGNDPNDPANRGGGHIATFVVTNHGPRGVTDATPYSHYSLLRTIEDAFGIHTYLRQANAPGVVPMTKLFALAHRNEISGQ